MVYWKFRYLALLYVIGLVGLKLVRITLPVKINFLSHYYAVKLNYTKATYSTVVIKYYVYIVFVSFDVSNSA